MREAVVVSSARTPIGKAYRGLFNDTEGPTMAAIAAKAAMERAGVDPAEIEDVIMGCALGQGTTGYNIGRLTALAAGCPVTVSGMTMDRQCSSGLMSVATAAKQIIHDGMNIAIGGGVEHISLVQNEHQNGFRAADPNLIKMHKDIYMPMLQTAEVVAKRYNVSRDVQDEYGFQSQQRTAAAQEAGLFEDEIVEVTAMMKHVDKASGKEALEEKTLKLDEGNRPSTTLEGLQSLKPVFEGGCITAGNASQLSDGAAACVLMDSKTAEQRNVEPLGHHVCAKGQMCIIQNRFLDHMFVL